MRQGTRLFQTAVVVVVVGGSVGDSVGDSSFFAEQKLGVVGDRALGRAGLHSRGPC